MCRAHLSHLGNSDRGRQNPCIALRFKRAGVIEEPASKFHQAQRPYARSKSGCMAAIFSSQASSTDRLTSRGLPSIQTPVVVLTQKLPSRVRQVDKRVRPAHPLPSSVLRSTSPDNLEERLHPVAIMSAPAPDGAPAGTRLGRRSSIHELDPQSLEGHRRPI